MAEDPATALELMEFTIGAEHTINFGSYENIKVKAQITCGVRRGTTDEQFQIILAKAEAKLKEIGQETYKHQKPKGKRPIKTPEFDDASNFAHE